MNSEAHPCMRFQTAPSLSPSAQWRLWCLHICAPPECTPSGEGGKIKLFYRKSWLAYLSLPFLLCSLYHYLLSWRESLNHIPSLWQCPQSAESAHLSLHLHRKWDCRHICAQVVDEELVKGHKACSQYSPDIFDSLNLWIANAGSFRLLAAMKNYRWQRPENKASGSQCCP